MVEAAARVGAPRLCEHLFLPMARATGSAVGLRVGVAETHFAIVGGDASLGQVGGALLLVFKTEQLLFNWQPRCHDLPPWVAAAAAASGESISVRHNLLQIVHASGAQWRVEMI